MNSSWIYFKFLNEYLDKLNLTRELIFKKKPVWRKKCAGKEILTLPQTNKLISKFIYSEEAFMVCRFGATEMNAINSYLQFEHFPHKDTRKQCIEKLCKLSGFFPNNIAQGEKFVDLMLNSCKWIDLCGIWNLYMEDYVLNKYAQNAQITLLDHLEPWNMPIDEQIKPWTSALKGKKVLVIHPFAETINSQYYNFRSKIFERKFKPNDILPDFELITIKAVQSLNFNTENIEYSDWFEALDSMIAQCKKTTFDVAIIGCGAYGFPLAAAIKQMGKGAVHLGGATQILFGILGKRWEKGEYKVMLDQIQNKYWTRPLPSEKLKNADEIENGCYW